MSEHPILNGYVTLSKWAIVASLLTGQPQIVANVALVILAFFIFAAIFDAVTTS